MWRGRILDGTSVILYHDTRRLTHPIRIILLFQDNDQAFYASYRCILTIYGLSLNALHHLPISFILSYPILYLNPPSVSSKFNPPTIRSVEGEFKPTFDVQSLPTSGIASVLEELPLNVDKLENIRIDQLCSTSLNRHRSCTMSNPSVEIITVHGLSSVPALQSLLTQRFKLCLSSVCSSADRREIA